jgi:hypothetical protein
MGEIQRLADAARQETAIARLRVAVENYVESHASKGKKEAEQVAKNERYWRERLAQKMADSDLSEAACLTQLALDFFVDEKISLTNDPEKLPEKDLLRLCVAARFFFRRDAVIDGWKEYEAAILKWEAHLVKVTKGAAK